MRNIKPNQIGCPALFLDILEELGNDLADITPINIEDRLLLAIKENERLQAEFPHLKTFLLYQVDAIKNQNERLQKFEAENPPKEWDDLYERRFRSIWDHLQGWMQKEVIDLKEDQESGGKPDYYITANFLAKEHKTKNITLRIEEVDPPKHFFKYLSEHKDLDGNRLNDGRENEWLNKKGYEPDPTAPRKYILGSNKDLPNSLANELFEKFKPVKVYYE